MLFYPYDANLSLIQCQMPISMRNAISNWSQNDPFFGAHKLLQIVAWVGYGTLLSYASVLVHILRVKVQRDRDVAKGEFFPNV